MDCAPRILHQIQVMTSLAIVRFLSKAFEDSLNPLDTYVMALLLVACTYVAAQEDIVTRLGRRLAVLLIAEKLRPLVLAAVEGQRTGLVHISTLMVNAAVVSALAVVPLWWRESEEGAVLLAAVQNLYGDFLLFAAHWTSAHLTLLVLCMVAASWANHELRSGGRVWATLLEVLSMGAISLALAILTAARAQADADVVRLLLLFALLHFAVQVPLAGSLETYVLLRVADVLAGYVVADHWIWCGFLAVAAQTLAACVGLGSWATQTCLLVLVNVAVGRAIERIHDLARYDTFLTLKACAVVLQLVTHELSRLALFHGQ